MHPGEASSGGKRPLPAPATAAQKAAEDGKGRAVFVHALEYNKDRGEKNLVKKLLYASSPVVGLLHAHGLTKIEVVSHQDIEGDEWWQGQPAVLDLTAKQFMAFVCVHQAIYGPKDRQTIVNPGKYRSDQSGIPLEATGLEKRDIKVLKHDTILLNAVHGWTKWTGFANAWGKKGQLLAWLADSSEEAVDEVLSVLRPEFDQESRHYFKHTRFPAMVSMRSRQARESRKSQGRQDRTSESRKSQDGPKARGSPRAQDGPNDGARARDQDGPKARDGPEARESRQRDIKDRVHTVDPRSYYCVDPFFKGTDDIKKRVASCKLGATPHSDFRHMRFPTRQPCIEVCHFS